VGRNHIHIHLYWLPRAKHCSRLFARRRRASSLPVVRWISGSVASVGVLSRAYRRAADGTRRKGDSIVKTFYVIWATKLLTAGRTNRLLPYLFSLSRLLEQTSVPLSRAAAREEHRLRRNIRKLCTGVSYACNAAIPLRALYRLMRLALTFRGTLKPLCARRRKTGVKTVSWPRAATLLPPSLLELLPLFGSIGNNTRHWATGARERYTALAAWLSATPQRR